MRTHDKLRKSGMVYVDCPTCQGTGTIVLGMNAANCTKCLGDGKVWQDGRDNVENAGVNRGGDAGRICNRLYK